MKGSIKSNPVFASRELKDIESWTGKLITPGVISKQTVSRPSSWQSSTWLVHNGNKGPTKFYSGGGGGRGKRRGLGPRNDVLTTCKAVIQRGGQRIITVFFPQKIFLDFLEARSEPTEEIRNA